MPPYRWPTVPVTLNMVERIGVQRQGVAGMTREQDLSRAVGFPEGPRWYVVQSRHHKELYAAMNLQNQVGHVQRL